MHAYLFGFVFSRLLEPESCVGKSEIFILNTLSYQDVSDLRAQIDSERKKNKDLCLNVVKLNGIIKTGQDALSQEQELVKKLQEQLDTKSVVSPDFGFQNITRRIVVAF